MEYTGDSGEIDEHELAIEAELVDDEDEIEIAIEAEAEAEPIDERDEYEHEATVAADEDAAEDSEADDEEVEAVAIEHAALDASAEQRVASRYRHPAAAAALAKRVAMDRSARIAVGSLVLVAFLFLFVFPTRSYLAQQRQVHDARHSVQVLREQNTKLAREAQRLQTDSEIEKLARSQFNMVFPGEEAYNVVPPNGSPTTTTEP
jgi:cell division protein FtsB